MFLAGCSGMGGGSRLLPGLSGPVTGAGVSPDGRRHRVAVKLRMTIPRRHRGQRVPLHPSTISSATQSVSIGVNGGAAKIFNATPSSPNCTTTLAGTVCTFGLSAPPGADTFAVKTFSATDGGGTVLDFGTALINIVAGQANSATVRIGPVVSSNADSGQGSLRYAVGSAANGDTIMFLLPAGSSTVTLSSPIAPVANVTIAGPGFTTSLRHHVNRHGVHSNTTYNGTTISGNNAQQLFIVNTGVSLTISGLVITQGHAAVAHSPGGAFYNNGTLTLLDDAITDNTSFVTTIRHTAGHRVHSHLRHARKKTTPASSLHPHACTQTSDQYGGAVYNDGLLAITGTTFDGNIANSQFYGGCTKSGYGGAIYNDTYGTIVSSGSTYVNNGAYEGGVVYNGSSYGQVTFTNDTFANNFVCTAVNG